MSVMEQIEAVSLELDKPATSAQERAHLGIRVHERLTAIRGSVMTDAEREAYRDVVTRALRDVFGIREA